MKDRHLILGMFVGFMVIFFFVAWLRHWRICEVVVLVVVVLVGTIAYALGEFKKRRKEVAGR